MKALQSLIPVFIFTLLFASCQEDVKEEFTPNSTSKLEAVLMDGSTQLMEGDEVELTTGYNFQVDLFKAYLSDITLVKQDGSEVLVKDVDILSLIEEGENSTSFEVPHGSYTGLRVGYGLNPAQNDANPSDFDDDHPLSNSQSMYWPMIKYRFVKLEGFAKSLSDSTNYLVSIHPGADSLYQVVNYSFATPLNIDGTFEQNFTISIDVNDLFDGPAGMIDFATDNANQVHMTPQDAHIGIRFMKNMAAATKLELQPPLQ